MMKTLYLILLIALLGCKNDDKDREIRILNQCCYSNNRHVDIASKFMDKSDSLQKVINYLKETYKKTVLIVDGKEMPLVGDTINVTTCKNGCK